MEIPTGLLRTAFELRQRSKKMLTFAFVLRVNITEIHYIIALGQVYT